MAPEGQTRQPAPIPDIIRTMRDLNALPLPDLYRTLAAGGLVERLIQIARDEDLGMGDGAGDITSEVCIRPGEAAEARLVAREAGAIAGLAVLPDVARVFSSSAAIDIVGADGQMVEAGALLAILRGGKRDILTIERTALNIVGRLSGIATTTSRYVQAAAGGSATRARIYDTRKTTPGLRMLEKYAVRCGGGFCHRIGLHDAVLIKDNHLAGTPLNRLAAFVQEAADDARKQRSDLAFVEVEVDSLDQFKELLTLRPGIIDIVLLDNMPPALLREAAKLRDDTSSGLQLEASGGIRIENIREIAETGVDRISIGALTHSAPGLDVALDIDDVPAGGFSRSGSGGGRA